ncbi:hypothetical protein FRC10_001501 [Ceratobasidium sp. 414]|nr:hypothetical protein FRC10_001501 [Ceratobasidium sp. 414]
MDEIDCSRFHIYAGFTKKLEVFPNHRTYALKHWQDALSYAEHHPLLPNLVSVIFDTKVFEAHPQYLWARMFLSPKLQEFRIAVSDSKVPLNTPSSAASALLVTLLDKCRELRCLSLFPSLTLQPHADEGYLFEGHLEQFKNPWLASNSLQELSTNTNMFSTLSRISSLPSLTRLRVYDDPVKEGDCSLASRHDFPCLRHLGIYNLANHATIEELWRILGQPNQLLTHLELEFTPRFWRAGGWPYGKSPVMVEVVSFLVAHSPRVTDLSMHCLPALLYEVRSVPTTSVMQLLHALPLERLCIIGARLENLLDGVLQHTFIHMKILELPHQCISISMLPCFAEHLPNLEYLSLDLQLKHADELISNDKKALALRVLQSNFLVFDPNYYQFFQKIAQDGYSMAYSLAKSLYMLYPNVQLETHLYVSDFFRYKSKECVSPEKAVDLINRQLKTLLGLNQGSQAEDVDFESVQILNEGAWGRCFT